MIIDLQARDFQLTDPLRQQIRQKLKAVLNRFGEKIHRVRVVLSDINGPKGGNDKRCVIKVKVNNHKTLVVDEVTDNIHESINRCARRVKHAITKTVSRNRKVSRESIEPITPPASNRQVDRMLEEEFEFSALYAENEQYIHAR